MDEILKTVNLCFRYEGNEGEEVPKEVLKNINVNINEGEFVAVLGHNGSGKSTLAKHFNAINLPSGGKVYALGLDTEDMENIYKIREKVGMVFQNPDNQLVATIVEEDVAFAPENLGIDPIEIRKRVDDALKAVSLYEYRDRAPHQLSGGQKQRIAIAGIIAMKPRCIILDEPTAMLDPSGREEVMNTLLKLNKEDNITIVLITHFMNEAVMADRVLVINEGDILLEGTPHEVFANAGLLKSIGLDVPQSTELMFALRRQGYRNPLSILTANECVEVIEEIINGQDN
ncbi:MAG: energy-coupling factor transporter ATPase [Clostridia bacterium]